MASEAFGKGGEVFDAHYYSRESDILREYLCTDVEQENAEKAIEVAKKRVSEGNTTQEDVDLLISGTRDVFALRLDESVCIFYATFYLFSRSDSSNILWKILPYLEAWQPIGKIHLWRIWLG